MQPQKSTSALLKTGFYVFLCIYLYICTWLDFGNMLFKKNPQKTKGGRKSEAWFLFILSLAFKENLTCWCNNQSMCVLFVFFLCEEIKFLRLSLWMSCSDLTLCHFFCVLYTTRWTCYYHVHPHLMGELPTF